MSSLHGTLKSIFFLASLYAYNINGIDVVSHSNGYGKLIRIVSLIPKYNIIATATDAMIIDTIPRMSLTVYNLNNGVSRRALPLSYRSLLSRAVATVMKIFVTIIISDSKVNSTNSGCASIYSFLNRLKIVLLSAININDKPILTIKHNLKTSSISSLTGLRNKRADKPDVKALPLCMITLRGIYETPR